MSPVALGGCEGLIGRGSSLSLACFVTVPSYPMWVALIPKSSNKRWLIKYLWQLRLSFSEHIMAVASVPGFLYCSANLFSAACPWSVSMSLVIGTDLFPSSPQCRYSIPTFLQLRIRFSRLNCGYLQLVGDPLTSSRKPTPLSVNSFRKTSM